jgi:hypothetical protein
LRSRRPRKFAGENGGRGVSKRVGVSGDAFAKSVRLRWGHWHVWQRAAGSVVALSVVVLGLPALAVAVVPGARRGGAPGRPARP